MTDINIPAAALEAGARAIYFAFTEVNIGDGEDRWERLPPRYRSEYREQARAAILAGLAAWPGMISAKNGSSMSLRPQIILPLPQEARDE